MNRRKFYQCNKTKQMYFGRLKNKCFKVSCDVLLSKIDIEGMSIWSREQYLFTHCDDKKTSIFTVAF